MSAGFIGRDDVVMRDITGERRSNKPATRQLGRNEIFAGLTDKFVASSSGHAHLGVERVG